MNHSHRYRKHKLNSLIVLAAVLTAAACATAPRPEHAFLTRAEISGFTETTRYDDAIDLLRSLDRESGLMRLEFFGESAEGRPLPLAVLGNPLPAGPEEIDRDETTVIYINANIHAGEVEGKESCLMLVRQIALGELANLLDGTILLVAPLYNPDGNERIDAQNRYWQEGPEGGVGIRTNAQSLDLNRDMIKLESPEAQSLVGNILQRWDPHVLVDCHTTNGSYHREPITYAPPHCPLSNRELLKFNRNVMLPWIDLETEKREGYASIPYGNFRDQMKPELGWYTFDHKPRYVTNYMGLRNRLSILIEMYVYAEYETRVRACRAFLHSLLAFAQEKGAMIRSVVSRADAAPAKAAQNPEQTLMFHTAFEQKACEDLLVIKGYRMEIKEDKRGRNRPGPVLDEPMEYEVPYYGLIEPTDEGTPLPDKYIFPRAMIDIRDKLLQHGIEVNEFAEPFEADVLVFDINEIDADSRLYQGHRLETLEGEWSEKKVTFPAGAWIVPTDQPLAMLAAYLLEPESDDSLATWNLMDKYLTRGSWNPAPGSFPVVKVMNKGCSGQN